MTKQRIVYLHSAKFGISKAFNSLDEVINLLQNGFFVKINSEDVEKSFVKTKAENKIPNYETKDFVQIQG